MQEKYQQSPKRESNSGGPRTPWVERFQQLWRRLRAYFEALFDPATGAGRRLRLVASGLAVMALILAAITLLYAIVLYPFTPAISDIRKAKQERPTVLVASNGETIAEFKPVNREWAPLDEVSDHVIDALIATEDHRFYGHTGIDLWRTMGAAFHTLTGRVQGGSTLTQQLARNLYPEEIGRSRSLGRKLKEAITAFKIEYAYTKDEILETYLNTVPFLYNAYGIEMAARTYFSKSASELDLLESATLVGMLKGTYYYNPVRNPERALERRNVVLRQMAKRDVLEEGELDALSGEPLGVRFQRQERPETPAPHFVEHVREWLIEWADRRGYNVYRDSLIVHTTLDIDLQRMAQQSVDQWVPALETVAAVEWNSSSEGSLFRNVDAYRSRRNGDGFDFLWNGHSDLINSFIRSTPQYQSGIEDGIEADIMLDSLRSDETFMEALRTLKTRLETGFVAMDPSSGEIRTWVGSRDYDTDQYDHVVRARRQPGSTFKPFVYAAALEEGLRPDDTFLDGPVEIRLAGGEVWQPRNSGGYSEEEMTLTDGLVYSKNTITAQVVDRVGARDVARLARKMGVRRSRLDEVPSIALGTSNVSLLEMVSAYSTFASGGIYREPVFVSRIEDMDGVTVFEARPRPRRVISEETALAVTDMMRGVVDRGTGQRVRTMFGLQGDLAGKTGTTQNNVDGWFILMHPNLVAGAWVGFNDPRIAFRSSYWGQGGNNAAMIVGDFFRRAIRASGSGIGTQAFPPAPELDDRSPSLLGRIGNWISDAASAVGDVIASGFNNILSIFGGGDDVEQIPDSEPQQPDGVPSADPDGDAMADSLNRMERESTQLNRYIDEIRARRQGQDAPPPEPEDAPPEEVETNDSQEEAETQEEVEEVAPF